MKFSLIFPTRNRVQMLSNLLCSIQLNTNNCNDIEALIGYDWDDTATCRVVDYLTNLYPWVKFHGRERGKSISKDYQNWLYPKSCGKYIFILNDDVVMATPMWDEIAFKKLEELHRLDGIVYGWINDSETTNRFNDRDHPYSCFPILSRVAVDILGYTMNEYYGGWGADVYLYQVYKGVDRIVDLSNIVVKHISPWLHLRDHDETNWSMQQMSGHSGYMDATPEIKRLAKHTLRPLLL